MPEVFVSLTCFCVGLQNQWCIWTGINCLRHIYYWISKNKSTYCRVRDRLIYTREKQNNHLMWKPKMCNYNSFYSKFVFELFKFSGCWDKKKKKHCRIHSIFIWLMCGILFKYRRYGETFTFSKNFFDCKYIHKTFIFACNINNVSERIFRLLWHLQKMQHILQKQLDYVYNCVIKLFVHICAIKYGNLLQK